MRLFRAGELAAESFPDPPFLVSPLLPRGGILVLHGAQGSGKTQIALTLAKAIVNGEMFLNHWPVTRGTVLFIEADMPLQGFQGRVVKGGSDGTHHLWTEALVIIELAKSFALPEAILEAQRLLPDLIIIDSIRQTHDLPENDTGTPKRVYRAWKKLFPGSAFCLLHHNRKKGTDGIEGSPREATRGADWLNEADAGIQLTRVSKPGEGHSAKLTFTKHRYMEEPPEMTVMLDRSTMLVRRGTGV